jgi:NitT/TauT family transport system ATP-binding protein
MVAGQSASAGPDGAVAGCPRELVYELSGVGVTLATASGPLRVLDDVSLQIGTGEIVGVVGRSGTGKTTLLRVLGGLIAATDGVATLGGEPIKGPPDTVVTVFQDYGNALLPWRTVERNVALPIERRLPRTERNERVGEALRLVGLEGRGGDYPAQLSGGMQQRVQIARALVLRPTVLLLDEPFGALDAMTKAAMQDELLELQQTTHCTIVFITHDLEEAIYLSDRVLVIAGAPGGITTELPTLLPRPRDQLLTRELPAYLSLRHRLYSALEQP